MNIICILLLISAIADMYYIIKYKCKHEYERIDRKIMSPNITNCGKEYIIYIDRCTKCGKIRKQKITLY